MALPELCGSLQGETSACRHFMENGIITVTRACAASKGSAPVPTLLPGGKDSMHGVFPVMLLMHKHL